MIYTFHRDLPDFMFGGLRREYISVEVPDGASVEAARELIADNLGFWERSAEGALAFASRIVRPQSYGQWAVHVAYEYDEYAKHATPVFSVTSNPDGFCRSRTINPPNGGWPWEGDSVAYKTLYAARAAARAAARRWGGKAYTG